MDKRTLKRLLIILVVSIIAIVLIKMALTKTYTSLNNAATVKKQAIPLQPSATTQEPAPVIIETPATSGVVEATTEMLPAASSVSVTE